VTTENTRSAFPSDELWLLVAAMCDGTITTEECAQLESLLRASDDAKLFYATYVDMHGRMLWRFRGSKGAAADATSEQNAEASLPSLETPPLVLATTSWTHSPSDLTWGMILFSYTAAVVITSVALLLAGVVKAPTYSEIADSFSSRQVDDPANPRDDGHFATQPNRQEDSKSSIPSSRPKYVGRITGGMACCWTNPRTKAAIEACGDSVAVGDEIALTFGLLEITYNTGAKVLLQGPITYQVDSPRGGFLARGKLTACVEKKEVSGQWSVASDQKSNPQSPIPNPPLFAVRTPTAVVTDLGTEFGVEVSDTGETHSHVFRGSVQLQQTGVATGKEAPGNTVVLHANEAASVKIQRGADEKDLKEKAAKESELVLSRSAFNATAFVRRLPTLKRVHIPTFNTGIHVAEGKPDPHWHIVARSDDPQFKPRPAMVMAAMPAWYINDIELAQWISLYGYFKPVPNGVTYTFQTQFDLGDVLPDTVAMDGWFVVDNHVGGIRLNGKKVAVPEHPNDKRAFNTFHSFRITDGFVAGTNVLEIDVENGDDHDKQEKTPEGGMGVRIELDGWGKAVESE
jgi:hypothetical protein